MTEPDLTPEQDAEVRRLLADARHTEPTPEPVVTRLDRVLANLADEPARSADVVKLADRRRKVGTILVAAAASVVAVVGIGQVVSNTGGADEASTADSAAEGAEDGAAPEAGTDQGGGRSRGQALAEGEPQPATDGALRRTPLVLRSERFADDAETLASVLPYASLDRDEETAPLEDSLTGSLSRVKNRAVCEPGSWGGGSYVAVLYDGSEGWVVLRQPQGDTRIADLFLCGSEVVVRSVTLPHP